MREHQKKGRSKFLKRAVCSFLSLNIALSAMVPYAMAETSATTQNPFSPIDIASIYDDPQKFIVCKDANNSNHPQIDASSNTLGWLGDGAWISFQNLDFGETAVTGQDLWVEMTRDGAAVSAATHFEIYAVPDGTAFDVNTPIETAKVGEMAALPPNYGGASIFSHNAPVEDGVLQGVMDLYFKLNTGSINLKSIRFGKKIEPIETDKENALIYNTAASNFNEALPMGNGFIGAMVYGGVQQERIGLNETTIWTGSPYENNVEGAWKQLEALREKTIADQVTTDEWHHAVVDTTLVDPEAHFTFSGSQKYQLAGELDLQTDHTAQAYLRYLDLDTATAVTQYRWNDSLITREYFVSNPDRVMAMRLTSDHAPMTFTGSYDLKGMVERGRTMEDGDTLVIHGGVKDYRTIKSGIEFTVRVKFLPKDGTVLAENNTITVQDTTDCVVLVTIATNFVSYKDISGDEEALAKEQMAKAAAKSYEQLKAAHIADYQELYSRVELDLGGSSANAPVAEVRQRLADSDDPAFVELAYNFDRYLQISASREGSQPTNLQGIWNNELRPAWDCNYTTNINLQMNYWPTLATNLEECYGPFMDKLKSFQDMGHETAKETYNITTEGTWTLHHNSDLWSVTAPVSGDGGITPTDGAWMANEAYNTYLYNQDRAYLEELYPIMKGAAQFLLEFMIEDENGQYMFCPSNSPEINNLATGQRVSVNSAFDIQVTTELFQNVMEAAEILGTDTEFVTTLEAAMKKLPPIVGIGSWGQVQEFYGYDADDPKNNHRHISNLYGVYPGTTITEDNEAYWNAAYKTLQARSVMSSTETLTGWSIAWRIIQFARFGDSAKSYEFIKTMYDMSYNYCLPNLFTVCPPFQYDANGGMLAAVTSMLVMDQTGAELLQGLPEQWKNGSVKGLRLKGNFTLDEMVWQDGKLVSAAITSHSGQPLDLHYGDKSVAMDTTAGETYVFDGELQLTNIPQTQVTVTFDTNGGSTIGPLTVTKGEAIAEPETPTKAGYTFAGWYSDEDLTKKYDFTTPVNGEMTLYAKWEQDSTEQPVCSANAALRSTAQRDEEGRAVFHLNLKDAKNIAAVQVTFAELSDAEITAASDFTFVADKDNTVVLTYLHDGKRYSCDGEGTIATIAVSGDAPSLKITEVKIASYDINGEPAFGEAVDLLVSEAAYTGYDLTGDQKVDLQDIVAAMKWYLSDVTAPKAVQADTNGDGAVDIHDLIQIMLHYT